ncbi:MAG: DUF4147 domain-containing protein [bacterium]|nr:DUF4147 domain-containing protein [bacterium]
MHAEQLTMMFQAAVAAVDPEELVEAALRRRQLDPKGGPVTVLALGKASAGMVWGTHRVFGDSLSGVAVLAAEADLPDGVRGYVGSHPIPDEASVVAGEALVEAAGSAPLGSLVLCLVSGGGSALAEVPAPGVSIGDLATVNRLLLESGAAIDEVNAVRRRLSQLKSGGLARHVQTADLVTLAISDVGAAGADTIASGPTVVCPEAHDPLEVLRARDLADVMPPAVLAVLAQAAPAVRSNHVVDVIADGATAAAAAVVTANRLGLSSTIAERPLAGEASDEARRVVADTRSRRVDVVVHAGETTVTVTGSGKGGRNHEAALAAAMELDGRPGAFLAAGTDGVDGMAPGAGAVVDGQTASMAREAGLEPGDYLNNNDSGGFFDLVPGRIVTGPTGTNVADIWLAGSDSG